MRDATDGKHAPHKTLRSDGKKREAEQSINFVTCRDGFTLNDLVSYNEKHNEANDNRSWNCGVEGPSDDPAVEKLRNRQVKNFLTVNLLALGVPMVLMGDEVRHTQGGNNHAYCQDHEFSWFDWTRLGKLADGDANPWLRWTDTALESSKSLHNRLAAALCLPQNPAV